MSSRWFAIRTCRTSRQGMSGVSCRSRHSRRFRAPTPGGSSFWTSAERLLGLRDRGVAAEVADEVVEVER